MFEFGKDFDVTKRLCDYANRSGISARALIGLKQMLLLARLRQLAAIELQYDIFIDLPSYDCPLPILGLADAIHTLPTPVFFCDSLVRK
jgi:hypothetical protein